jgi:hypothetical protein
MVGGRVARIGAGVIAIMFRQDEATLERVDRALDMIARRNVSMAA